MTAAAHASAPRDGTEFTVPYRHPYHLGLYLAVNAISDAYAVIDGPDCLYRKAEWVHGSHDACSTLLDVLGNHRVVPTLMNSDGVIKSTGDEVARRLRRVAKIPTARLALVCSMPHVTIIGTQYGKILDDLRPELGLSLVEVPSRSLEGDWLTGYADTLTAIAARLDVSDAAPARGRVAVIGNLMDRVEFDHRANVAEIERLLAAIGAEPVSTWLSGRPYAHLEQAKHAGTIVALPHGLAAAQALARRTGARVVEAPAPFGLAATRRLLDLVAAAIGTEDRVGPVVHAELGRLVPRVEWVVDHAFRGRRVAFSGDPALFAGFCQIAEELGMEVAHLSAPARKPHAFPVALDEAAGIPVAWAPTIGALRRDLAALHAATPIDLVVAGSYFDAVVGLRTRRFEFGFPSQRRHVLRDSPFLGFEGWIGVVDEMARALLADSA